MKKVNKCKNEKVRDALVYELKERGWSYRKIAKYYEERGIKISAAALQLRCKNIYKKMEKEIPKTIRRTNEFNEIDKGVTSEEIFNLKQSRYTYKKIQEFYQEKGIKLSIAYIVKVCKEECQKRGIRKLKKGISETMRKYDEEEIFNLREKKLSYQKIADYITKKYGISVSYQAIRTVCKKIYKNKKMSEPRIPRNKAKKVNICDEEIIALKRKGYSYKQMVPQFKSVGKKCSKSFLSRKGKSIFGVLHNGLHTGVDIRTANPQVVKNALINLKNTKGATQKQINYIASYYGFDFDKCETNLSPYGIYDLDDKKDDKENER